MCEIQFLPLSSENRKSKCKNLNYCVTSSFVVSFLRTSLKLCSGFDQSVLLLANRSKKKISLQFTPNVLKIFHLLSK